MTNRATEPQMEKPPEFTRRVVLNGRQLAGVLLLLLLPVLAVFQLLGDARRSYETTNQGLALHVEAPVSARHGNMVRLRIKVAGVARMGGQVATIAITQGYLNRFSGVRARPEIAHVTEDDGVILQELPRAGSAAEAVVEMTPEDHGWAHGAVRVSLEAGVTVELKFKTFIFP